MAVSRDSGRDSSKAQSFQQGGCLNCASIRGGVQAKLPSMGGWIGGWMAEAVTVAVTAAKPKVFNRRGV